MHNILAIWQREMKSYFVSPIAYVVLTVYLFLSGLFFYGRMKEVYDFVIQSQGRSSQPLDFPQIVMMSVFSSMALVLLFVVPMLTMGLFSEEKKRGTIELLLTTPISNFQVIAGKYSAGITFLLILLASNVLTISPLFLFSRPDFMPFLCGYLGIFLYGAAILALGLFVSTLTENQIVAVIITFGASLGFLLVNYIGSAGNRVVEYLSVTGHLEDFIKGVIDTSHVVYYLTFAFLALFLAYRSLESMRWRG